MKKKCSICHNPKDLSEFHKRKGGILGRTNNCKTCQAEYIRKHYRKDKAYYIDKARKRQEANNAFLYRLKDNKPCFDCKVVHRFFALDYDHRGEDKKVADVSYLARVSRKKLLTEIVKCDLVCATCHRYRTYNRKHAPIPN